MTHTVTAAIVLTAALFTASQARAQPPSPKASASQGPSTVTLRPENPTRWDVSGHVGWLGVNKSEITPERWNDWYDVGSFGASAGYYWTPHLKLEFDVATSTEGSIYSYEQIFVPGQAYPQVRSREHFFRATSAGAAITYQFLENTWFHPFAGGGVEVTRETSRIWSPPQFLPIGPGREPVFTAPVDAERETSYSTRPFIAAGFKWYVSERAFIRSDIRSSFSSKHAETVVWRGGVGFDF